MRPIDAGVGTIKKCGFTSIGVVLFVELDIEPMLGVDKPDEVPEVIVCVRVIKRSRRL